MTKRTRKKKTEIGEKAPPKYRMRLFVAGDEANSTIARASLDKICETYLEQDCRVEIIDVLEDFRPALEERVLVTPALVITEPGSRTVLFGNMTDTQKVLDALHIAS